MHNSQISRLFPKAVNFWSLELEFIFLINGLKNVKTIENSENILGVKNSQKKLATIIKNT